MATADMEFRADGSLIYAVQDDGGWNLMFLTHRVEGDMLVSNQPSAPREERTAFSFDADGELVLSFGGVRNWYRRAERRFPDTTAS